MDEHLNSDKLYINDLEVVISKVSMLRSIDPQISKYLSELALVVKDLALLRYDKSMISLKLKQKDHHLALIKQN
jgi:hypothetical protein